MSKHTKNLVLAALFAALTCVATMAIRIPIPGTSGYIHPGDALVILSGVFLGPLYGAFAAGIGSALSDLIGGYMVYVPITFVIKGLVALTAGFVFAAFARRQKKKLAGVVLGGVADMVLVVFGYFICEIPLYGLAAAAASMGPNLIQGAGGLLIAVLLYPILAAIPEFRVSLQ